MTRILSLGLVLTLCGLAAPARADTGANTVDDLTATEIGIYPNVIFLVDLSIDMGDACVLVPDSSGAMVDSPNTCLADVTDAITSIVRHYDDVRFGVIGTAEDGSDASMYPIAPVGSTDDEIASALASLSAWNTDTRNFAEALVDLSDTYLQIDYTLPDDGVDTDGDGFTGDWAETPITFTCQDTLVVVLGRARPFHDSDVSGSARGTAPTDDVICDGSGVSTTESECYLDNVAQHLFNYDESGLDDTQRVLVSVIGLGLDTGSTQEALADTLFSNTAAQDSSMSIYTNASTADDIRGGVLEAIDELRSGTVSRSQPVVSADGHYIFYPMYDMGGAEVYPSLGVGNGPLNIGYLVSWELDNDNESATWGQIIDHSMDRDFDPDEYWYGNDMPGPFWDAGLLLYSRPVESDETQPGDNDGFGKRDIYFWEDNAAGAMADAADHALSFDADFVNAVSASSTLLDLYFDTTTTTKSNTSSSWTCAADEAYDLDADCAISSNDVTKLVDFIRGYPEAEFKYVDGARGYWKLGESPYSVPAVVTARNNNYTNDPTYQAFLQSLEDDGVPDIVLLAANDGMLHAFQLEDDPLTATGDEGGQELWAWIPGYLLLRDRDAEWSHGLLDLMWYGSTYVFDGTPVVEDVWIDEDNDNAKATDGSEWHRVVVVQQGRGGPSTLALDITDTQSPKFLWEQTHDTDGSAQGYGTSRPVVFNLDDNSAAASGGEGKDVWVAMWATGRAVHGTSASGTNYFTSTEANLYTWAMADDAFTGGMTELGFSAGGDNIGDLHPDIEGGNYASSQLQTDTDTAVEYGYISAPIAVVDVNADGDGDVAYFPVSTPYASPDEGDGKDTEADPGSSWMYKAIFDPDNPGEATWCEFYDPYDAIGRRPEVYYSVTTAWHRDGQLGIYWGTGSPFNRGESGNGYLFAMKDPAPTECSTPQPISCDGNDLGYYELADGESLTSEPIVYAGILFATTYTPDMSDKCDMGTGRVYALYYDDCSGALDDIEGTGGADDGVEEFTDALVSGIAIGPGTVYVGVGSTDGAGLGAHVEAWSLTADPLFGTSPVAWMEMY
jgi:hypothetical protein